MSFAGFSFPQRLRTVSAQLRSAAGLDEPTPGYSANDSFAAASDWNPIHYASESQLSYHDPFGELAADGAYAEFGVQAGQPSVGPQGLGFDMSMQMNGIEEESSGYVTAGVKHEEVVETIPEPAADAGHQTRFQTRSTRSQAYPTSSPFASASRSRTSSLASQQSLQLSTLSSPSSSFFPSPLPSPFRDHPASFTSECSGTINPAASIRDSSPSEASSSNLTFARDESVESSQASEPTSTRSHRRTDSVSSRTSARGNHLKHTRRNSASPTKGYSPTKAIRRLLPSERREICLFQRANPTMKQDEIGKHFKYERSTISKTLKHKAHWLSDQWDQGEPDKFPPRHSAKASSISSPASDEETFTAEHTPNLTSVTPQPSPSLGTSTTTSSIFVAEPSPAPSAGAQKGRFPAIDQELTAWARQQVPLNTVLSDTVLQNQAKQIAKTIPGCESFKASHTWVEGFKARAGIYEGTFRDAVSTTMSRHASRQSVSLDEVASAASAGGVDDEDDSNPRRSSRQRRSIFGSKTLHRLSHSQSSFSFGLSRPSSPAPSLSSSAVKAVGPASNDFQMDSEATPTHSTVHTRTTTGYADQASGLAEPNSYSPTPRGEGTAFSTPSRVLHSDPSSLVLGDFPSTDHGGAYHGSQQAPYGFGPEYANSCSYDAHAFRHPFGSLSTSSSQSSLANFDLGTSTSSLAPANELTASPAPSFHHHRSGSTASSTSVYSGLTAFSSANGTPLTSSAYGSFRTSPSDACSNPSTPAHGSYFEASQLQSFAPSPLQQPPAFQQPQAPQADTAHLRYPSQPSLDSSLSSSTSSARRATISGGAPFQGRNSVSAATPSTAPGTVRGPVSLDDAYSSLQTAMQFLGVNEGFARPGDFILLSEIMSKMQARRDAQGVNLAALSAPATTLNSPFQPSSSHASPFPSVPGRLKLQRTQSASNVPTTGNQAWPLVSHRSKASSSLIEVDGH
ncbi:hypothetical protein JCM10212_000039 [Sporobolomyces blumeae]